MKESIHIDNPFNVWKKFEKEDKKEHASLLYTLSTHIHKNRAVFHLELKHLQDHIPQASLRDYWALANAIDREAPYKVTIAVLPNPIENTPFLLFYSIPGLIAWPLLYFFSRKKRLTQDLLSFHIGNFRKFYLVITMLSTIYISASPAVAAFITGGITLLTALICNFIVLRRAIKIPLFFQGFIALHACLVFYLIFAAPGTQLAGRVLALGVSSLYLGSSLFTLKKVRGLLLQEKQATSST